MPTPGNNIQAAYAAAQLLGPVHPCHGKNPKPKSPKLKNWPQRASRNTATIGKWWRDDPEAAPGIATGGLGRLFILDIDVKDGKRGFDSLAELTKCIGAMPDSFTVMTPSDGAQILMTAPGDIRFGNTAGFLGDGLDTRCDGGYGMAPGARLEGRRPYMIARETHIAPMPGGLVERLAKLPVQKIDADGARGELAKLAHALSETQDGRNNMLNRAAFQLAAFVRVGALTEAELHRGLREACQDNGFIREHGERAFEMTFRSGFKAGWGKPNYRLGQNWIDADDQALLALRIEDAVKQLQAEKRGNLITAKFKTEGRERFHNGSRNAALRNIFELKQAGRAAEADLLLWIMHLSGNEFHRCTATASTLARIVDISKSQVNRLLARLHEEGRISMWVDDATGELCRVVVPIEDDFDGVWLAPLSVDES